MEPTNRSHPIVLIVAIVHILIVAIVQRIIAAIPHREFFCAVAPMSSTLAQKTSECQHILWDENHEYVRDDKDEYLQ